MKKVRLFAVAAAMGMFASSVSAATQIGPVVTKTSGSFAWGEFASVMKVDMGDKVVAPQVTVTATTEGRTTDVDYSAYKAANGLTKNSTCYVGFTNTVGKDTNQDGLNDTPLYVIGSAFADPQNPAVTDTLKYFSSVDEAVEYWAAAGSDLFGARILAPGQGEIEDAYTLAGSTQTFEDLEAVFDYLVESGIIEVEKDEDSDLISKVTFASQTFYEAQANGYDDTAKPLGTMSLVYYTDIDRAKEEVGVKEDIADLFVIGSTTQGASYASLITSGYGNKGLQVEISTTTGLKAYVGADYYYPTSVTKGEVDNYSGVIKASEIANYGAALIVEYNNRYDTYEPNAAMTETVNEYISFVEATKDILVELAKTVTPTVTTASSDATTYAAAIVKDLGLEGTGAVAAATYVASLATWTTSTSATSAAIVTAASSKAEKDFVAAAYAKFYTGGSTTDKAVFDAVFAGNQDTANKSFTVGKTGTEKLVDLFEYAGLDYHPETSSVNYTFVETGRLSILEYDSARDEENDFYVVSFAKKPLATKGQYQTIKDAYYDIVDSSWATLNRVALVNSDNSSNTSTTFSADFSAQTTTVLDAVAATNDVSVKDFIEGLELVSTPGTEDGVFTAGQLGALITVQTVPENETDYIVLNLPSSGAISPVSQSRTKGTASYVSKVTGEEVMVHFVELQNVKDKRTQWYPAFETMAEVKDFLRIVLGIHTPDASGAATHVDADKYLALFTAANARNYHLYQTITWVDGTSSAYYLPKSVLADSSAVQCTYSTNKGSDVKTEAASVSFDASKVDTTKAGVYTATLTAKAGETTETKEVTVVVAPKYSRTWDNKGRVSTLKAYWLSGNLYAEYKYTYNADNTITVVSTFYREDGVTVADTATTTK